jgi:hypothetical protein
MRGTAVRPRSDEVCVNITFKAFMSVDARFALNSCRSRIGNVTIRLHQKEKSSPCDLGCRISAFTILSYTYTHVSRAAQQKPPKNTPLFPWHFLLPDVHLKPGLLCLFLRKCYYYLDEERDEWGISTIDIKTHLTTLVRSTFDSLPKDIHFLSHELLHLRIRNTWL